MSSGSSREAAFSNEESVTGPLTSPKKCRSKRSRDGAESIPKRLAQLRPGARWAFRLKLEGWKAAEQPGVTITDRDQLFDLMDGRR